MSSIPPCYSTSFPSLLALFLHDNELGGAVPSSWNLPSLNSVAFSNNKHLHGTLPGSLFTQPVLLSVIVEGTSLHGYIPYEVCQATELQSLLLSGNALKGSLPECLPVLQRLETLRVAHNKLTGSLPAAIGNMSSLQVFDVSNNRLHGSVPESLGDKSQDLTTTSLELNLLSCHLPHSVRHWKKGPDFDSLSLLSGNLFGCGPGSGVFSLGMKHSPGLQSASREEFDTYSCGGSDWVLPAIAVLIFVTPVLAMLCWSLLCRGGNGNSDDNLLSFLKAERLQPGEKQQRTSSCGVATATQELRRLALSVFGAGGCAGLAMLLLVFTMADSEYHCEYTTNPSLANKRAKENDDDDRLFSAGIGVVASMAFSLSLYVWWRRLFQDRNQVVVTAPLDGIGCNDDDDDAEQILHQQAEDLRGSEAFYSCELRPSEHINHENENNFDLTTPPEEKSHQSPMDESRTTHETIVRQVQVAAFTWRSAKLLLLLVLVLALTIAPNTAYVFVVLSTLPYDNKLKAELGISAAKVLLVQSRS